MEQFKYTNYDDRYFIIFQLKYPNIALISAIVMVRELIRKCTFQFYKFNSQFNEVTRLYVKSQNSIAYPFILIHYVLIVLMYL